MQFGKAITHLRKQNGIQQKDFAKKIAISQTYLSLIENDKKFPTYSTLVKISDGLDIPIPIMFFLSLDEKDVPEKKRGIYKEISPFIESFIERIFISNKKR